MLNCNCFAWVCVRDKVNVKLSMPIEAMLVKGVLLLLLLMLNEDVLLLYCFWELLRRLEVELTLIADGTEYINYI